MLQLQTICHSFARGRFLAAAEGWMKKLKPWPKTGVLKWPDPLLSEKSGSGNDTPSGFKVGEGYASNELI